MSNRPRAHLRLTAGAAAAALAAAAAGPARADNLTIGLEPHFVSLSQRSTDQSGVTTSHDEYDFGQRYSLALSRTLYPLLIVNGTGNFGDERAWITTQGVDSYTHDWNGNGYGRLTLGTNVLNGVLGYDHAEASSSTRGLPHAPRLIRDVWSATALWRPADLPQLVLHLSREDTHDAARRDHDAVSDSALLSAVYRGIPNMDLQYSLGYVTTENRLSQTDTALMSQALQASWGDKLFGGRTNAHVSARIATSVSTTSTTGAGGTVSTQRFPIAGYSLIDTFPATPDKDTLVLNPALVNGDLGTGAGLNIGYGVSPGDTDFRDIGAQFSDVLTRVNRVYVWVSKPLPANVVTAYNTWAAYQSDDNISWTPVPLAGPVRFADFQNRFEIPIAEVQARYLKVVVRPLALGVTTDSRFAEVLVTEIQLFLEVPAASVVGRMADTSEAVSATSRTRILSVPDLAWDFSLALARASRSPRPTYALTNGLSVLHRFDPIWSASGRVERQDYDGGNGHSGGFDWGGTLSARPLPTLSHAFSYSGAWTETRRGAEISNSVNLVNHAELYRGVSVLANATASDTSSDTGRDTKSVGGRASASLIPNKRSSLSGGYSFIQSWLTPRRGATIVTTIERIDATGSLTPFEALYLAGSVGRVIRGPRPTTLAGGSAALSPFAGGMLQIRLTYSESIDTASDATVRLFDSGVHWLIRPGVLLDTAYTWIDNVAAATRARTSSVQATLTITI